MHRRLRHCDGAASVRYNGGMQERRLRFDLLIAFFAVLISAAAAGVAAYQTWVINEQFSATVWPYLDLDATYETGRVQLSLRNDGLGPALIRSAELRVDGKSGMTWKDLFTQLPHPRHGRFGGSLSSIGDGSVIRPGDSHTLVDMRGSLPPPPVLAAWEASHRVELVVCYCSLLQRCWQVTLITGKTNDPQNVRTCGPPTTLEAT